MYDNRNSHETYIKVNNVNYSPKKQAMNFVIVEYDTGQHRCGKFGRVAVYAVM